MHTSSLSRPTLPFPSLCLSQSRTKQWPSCAPVSMSVNLTGGPAVTSCFGFIGQGLNIWSCFGFGLSSPVCLETNNRQQLAQESTIRIVLLQEWRASGSGVSAVPVWDFGVLARSKEKSLVLQKVDDKPAGIHLSRLWCCWCGFALTLKNTPGGPKTSRSMLLPPAQILSSEFLTQLWLDKLVWSFKLKSASLVTSWNYSWLFNNPQMYKNQTLRNSHKQLWVSLCSFKSLRSKACAATESTTDLFLGHRMRIWFPVCPEF